MANFDETLERMRTLYTYGQNLNESKVPVNYSIEYKAQGADGVTYGIIRECKKFYIKSAPKGAENIAESYNYIGGFNNKKQYEYSSYNDALKNLELKLSSINEAHNGEVETSSLSRFMANDIMSECTESMMNEIARYRQIMYNAAMLMNESTEIGASRKDDTVMFDGKNPEAETGKKGDEDYKETKPEPEYKGSKTGGVDKKAEPFNNEPGKCPDQLKEGAECGDGECCGDEVCPKCGKAVCVCGEGECGGSAKDPKNIGWDMKGAENVNEGMSDECGMQEINAECGMAEADDEGGDEDIDLGVDGEVDDIAPETGDEDDFSGDENAIDGDEDEYDVDLDIDDIDDIDGSEEDMAAGADGETDDLQTALDSELDSEDDGESFDGEGDDMDIDAAEIGDDAEMGDDVSVSDDEIGDEAGDDEIGDGEDNVPAEGDEETEDGSEFFDEKDFLSSDESGDEESDNDFINSKLDEVINRVVNSILKEDELHVFGKHPGYRKKPMQLPATGEDKTKEGEDWNDESVASEEPFGSKIGDGAPFEEVVSAVMEDVKKRINESLANKKKVK